MSTVPPVVSPVMMEVIMVMIWLEVLTAARPAASENWPTTIMSTTA